MKLYRIVDYDPDSPDMVFIPGDKTLILDTQLADIAEAWNEWKMKGASDEQFVMAVDAILMELERSREE